MVLTFGFFEHVCLELIFHSSAFYLFQTLVIKKLKSGYLLQTKEAKLFLCILYLSVVEFSNHVLFHYLKNYQQKLFGQGDYGPLLLL